MGGILLRGAGPRPAASAALVISLGIGGMLALAGCGSNGSTDASALPPVIVDLGDVDGTTVEVTEGGTIDLTGDDGSAQFNPGLTAKSVGETDVTLDNGETGDSVTFTVDVVPKAPGGS